MTTRRKTKFIDQTRYVAEVEVDVIEDETSWSPYLFLEDAQRLDRVREALSCGDVKTASRFGHVSSGD